MKHYQLFILEDGKGNLFCFIWVMLVEIGPRNGQVYLLVLLPLLFGLVRSFFPQYGIL